MSKLFTFVAVAAAATVASAVGYVTYRVKSGKTKLTVTVAGADTAAPATEAAADTAAPATEAAAEPAAMATEAVDPLVAALRELTEQEAREYVEYIRATKPRLFIEVDVEYSGGYVWLTKAGRTIQLANLINITAITEALKELQEEPESNE